MSLAQLKKSLAIDQRNLLTAEVVSDSAETATVRTADGKQIRALKTRGVSFSAGQLVELATSDGRNYTATGSAPLAALGGEVVYTV